MRPRPKKVFGRKVVKQPKPKAIKKLPEHITVHIRAIFLILFFGVAFAYAFGFINV